MRFLIAGAVLCWGPFPAVAWADVDGQAETVEMKLMRGIEERAKAAQLTASFGVMFVCGALCALWAQNTGRSAWLWFCAGFAFSIITVIIMLRKNAEYRRGKGLGVDIRPNKADPGSSADRPRD
jgi:hypothetical protein